MGSSLQTKRTSSHISGYEYKPNGSQTENIDCPFQSSRISTLSRRPQKWPSPIWMQLELRRSFRDSRKGKPDGESRLSLEKNSRLQTRADRHKSDHRKFGSDISCGEYFVPATNMIERSRATPRTGQAFEARAERARSEHRIRLVGPSNAANKMKGFPSNNRR